MIHAHALQRRGLLALALIFGALTASACGPLTTINAPAGYVMLDDDDFRRGDIAHKALSADGAVLVVRERDHEPRGSLTFWTEAFEREIVDAQGYTLIEAESVEARDGLKGKLLKFKGTRETVVYRYDVALFLARDTIITVEAAAPEEEWEKLHEEKFNRALRTLRFD